MPTAEATVEDGAAVLSDEAQLARRAKAQAGSYKRLGKALGYDRAGVERIRRLGAGETQRPGSDLVDDLRLYLRGEKIGDDTSRTPGASDIEDSGSYSSTHPSSEPMEVPQEHAREVAFGPTSDHPLLSTIAVHPDYVVLGMDGQVRFRVSYLVEGVPPIVRQAGPGDERPS